MKRSFSLLYFLCFVFTPGFTQQPEEKLNRWAEQNPIEKIYLHLDRDEYVAGQTLWLKAYLYADFLPSDKSTVLFVELLNSSSTLLSRLSLPVFRAVSQGQFELPDTLSAGKYILRAYTATMLNHDADFVYKRSISISGKERKISIPSPASSANNIHLDFFPEGGNFVASLPNTIAFKATDPNGWPVNIKGVLKNNKDEIISEFSSSHDGMGMFDVDAVQDAAYYVELKDDPSKQKYPLPEPVAKGVVFRLLNAPDGIHFEIFQRKEDPSFQAAYMIGQMQHHAVFKQPLKQGTATLSGVINTAKLSSGILHITVFNKDGIPLAERLSFVNNKEYIKEAQLLTDTLSFSPRGKNHFSLTFKDSVTGSFSVSVTDPAFHSSTNREENIFSRLLLTADLKGYVHNPAFYFSSDNDSVAAALDLLIMTHGWRRFKWEQLTKDSLPPVKYKDPSFVSLSGRVLLQGTKKPFADKDMLIYIVAADSTKNMQLIKTDANGNYRADSLIFFEKAKVLFSDIKGKKSKFVDIKPGEDSLRRPFNLPVISKDELLLTDMTGKSNEAAMKKLSSEYEAIIRANGLILSEIVIKSKKKSPLEELEEKYTSGAFSGESRRTIDLLNTNDALGYENIFEYLAMRVQGLTVTKDDSGNYFVFFRQMASISSMGNQGMDIFLDEVLTDANAVSYINPNQIAMVKVYSTFVGSTGGGAGGALAIYLKKGTDYFNSLPNAGEMIAYNGFSVIKEFYSPNYAVPQQNNSGSDHRITLHWKPDIFVNGKNIKLPFVFYNNDRTKSFKIVVEGMTVDGKMLMMEKIISAKPF